MDGRKVLLAGLLLLGTADLAVLDLVAAPAWVNSAVPTASARRPAPVRSPAPTRAAAAPPPASTASAAATTAPTAITPASASVASSATAEAPSSAAPEPGESPALLAGAPKLPALLFEKGSARLTPAAVDALMKASRYLKAFPEASLAIHGHGWDGDDPEANRTLSERRAAVTADFLVAVGVDRGRLRTVAHGSEAPAGRSDNAEAMARNRRVELVFEARASSR